MSHASLRRFRLVAILEGISFLALLGIAMPLKYLAGLPLAVKYTGWTHGLLFILFVCFLADVAIKYKWPLKQSALALLASLLPFGPFLLDARLIKKEMEKPEPET